MNACRSTDPRTPAGPVRSALHKLASGVMPLVLLAAAVPAMAQTYPAQLTNTATLTVTGVNDPDPDNNVATDVNTLAASADVAIEKTFLSTAPFLVGQTVEYRLVISNNGPSVAQSILVTDTPVNLRIDEVTGACTALPCTIASLAPGATATIELEATILAAGAFSNSATATSPTDDPDPDNNEDDGGGGNAGQPTATLSVAPASAAEDSGTPFVYTLEFDVAPAVDTVVELEFTGTATAGTDYTGQITTITMPAGQSSITFNVVPVADTEVEPDETVIVTVQAGTGYAPGTVDSATATILNDDASADVDVEKTFNSTGPFLVGQEVSYTIVVSNAGPSVATDIEVVDTPTNLDILTVTGDCAALPCTIASLASGGTATINLTARIVAAGIFGNTVTANSDDVPDPDPTNNEDDGGGGNAGVPGASISVAPTSVAEDSGDSLVFTVTLDQAPAVDTVINLSYGGTATSDDYTGAQATITIPAGSTTGSVSIVPIDDNVLEPDETVIVTVETGTGYSITTPTATGIITNDDLPTADLSISKSDGASTYVPGGSATYVITVSNAGPDAAPGVVVTDNLPAGVTLSGPWTCTAAGGSTCSAASGGAAGGSLVQVTVDMSATGTVTIEVPVVFSSDPADY